MSEIKKASANIGGPAFGNGIAYFVLWYLGKQHGVNFEDPELALAMGGAVIASLLFYIGRGFTAVGNGIKFIIDRVFPSRGGPNA